MKINKRNVAICVLLSFFVPFYYIYWLYLLVKNTRALITDRRSCAGEMLCLIFVPFYSLYWWDTRGQLVKDEFSDRGCSARGNKIVYLILWFFGLEIISMAIMQNDFNALPSKTAGDDVYLYRNDRCHVANLRKKAKAKGMTLQQYILRGVPKEVIATCRDLADNENELKKYLLELLESGVINRDAYEYLLTNITERSEQKKQ